MTRARAALAFALVTLAPAAAFAGGNGYVSLGVGATATTGGDLESFNGSGTAGSLFVGQKFGVFSLEAGLSKFGFENSAGQTWSNIGLAAAGKLTVPVMPMFGAYLRAGIEKTWSDSSRQQAGTDLTGTGWLAGIGAEYKLNLSFTSAAVWADYTRHATDLVNDTMERDGNVDVVSLGITVGF